MICGALLLVAACGVDPNDAVVRDDRTPKPVPAVEAVAVDVSSAVVTDTVPPRTGPLLVPEEFDTIQAAVDAATPGDLILIAPGTYNEAVNVTTDELTIRGLSRSDVVLDGQFDLDNGIRVLGAKGVAIENMTAMNYTKNGFFWTGATGYRGSYLTAYRNGDYGIYAFDSTKGLLEHSYGGGSPDAGFYIGECFACDAVVDDVLSENNGLGYSGTNAGGNLLIINSIFRNNRAGIVPNSGSYELCYPQRQTTIVGNLVYSNNQADTPAIDVAILAMGNGILSAGGVLNRIERNRVWDHDKTGIGLVPFLEEGPADDQPPASEWNRTCEETKADPAPDPATVPSVVLWDSQQNEVIGNVLEDNREGDLAVASAGTDISTLGNCFSDNEFVRSRPAKVETLAPCGGGAGSGDWSADTLDVAQWLVEAGSRPASVDYRTAKLPPVPKLPDMPDAATAPANPATNVPPKIDLDAITVPARP
jgi:hypothetical protein